MALHIAPSTTHRPQRLNSCCRRSSGENGVCHSTLYFLNTSVVGWQPIANGLTTNDYDQDSFPNSSRKSGYDLRQHRARRIVRLGLPARKRPPQTPLRSVISERIQFRPADAGRRESAFVRRSSTSRHFAQNCSKPRAMRSDYFNATLWHRELQAAVGVSANRRQNRNLINQCGVSAQGQLQAPFHAAPRASISPPPH